MNGKTRSSDIVAQRMTAKVPVFGQDIKIKEAKGEFLSRIKKYDTINYVYVTDAEGMLAGVFSTRELFTAPASARLKEIMVKEVITAHAHTHQETAALLAIKHNIKAIPVVDRNGKFLGAVPSDAILAILHEENIEDLLRFAGIHRFMEPAREIVTANATTHIEKRLPWLLLGLLGGIGAAMVVGFFEQALQVQVLLAAFIPTVVYMADAVGTQTQTLFIRSLGLEQKLDMKRYVLREIKVALVIAVFVGALGAGISFVWHKSPLLGAILGTSLFATAIMASGVAIALPWIFYRLNYDPAIASGPFATAIRDIVSLVIYFLIATAMINLTL